MDFVLVSVLVGALAVPPVLNVALCPAGRFVRFAVSVVASPSGSVAETFTVRSEFSAPDAVAGAVTTGARSVLAMVIVVDADPDKAFVAVKLTE